MHLSSDVKQDIAELLDTAAYLVCQQEDITKEEFQNILTSQNIATKLFKAADQNRDGELALADILDFFLTLAKPT